jgi:hypothetical protein
MKEQILGMDKEMFSWMMALIIIPLYILIMFHIKLLIDYFHNKKNKRFKNGRSKMA